MKLHGRNFRIVVAFAALAVTVAAPARAAQPEYRPELYQSGKDVVWVPSSAALVERMLDMVKLTPQDYLVDLGSGDGITVIKAAKRGARAHGIEYNPDLVALSKRNAEKEGVTGRATFEQGDIFRKDFSRATVVSLFLLRDLNLKLRPTLLKMKPGTRIVSNTFDMGEWQPDITQPRSLDCENFCTAYAWTVPAQVAGVWRLGDGELHLTQSFQMLDGVLHTAGASRPITEGRMDGARMFFTVDGARYVGEVRGDTVEGARSGAGSWQARRLK